MVYLDRTGPLNRPWLSGYALLYSFTNRSHNAVMNGSSLTVHRIPLPRGNALGRARPVPRVA